VVVEDLGQRARGVKRWPNDLESDLGGPEPPFEPCTRFGWVHVGALPFHPHQNPPDRAMPPMLTALTEANRDLATT
jgi:hypothetical protein